MIQLYSSNKRQLQRQSQLFSIRNNEHIRFSIFISLLLILPFYCAHINAQYEGNDEEGFQYQVNLDTKEASLFAFYSFDTYYCSTSAHWNIPEYVDIRYYGKNPQTNRYGWFTDHFHVTSIGSISGSGMINVETIAIPNSIKSIGDIGGCPKLREISIPSSVESVGRVYGCNSLTSLTIPNGVVSFGGCSCTNIEEINLPNSLKTLGTITDCKNLKEIHLPNNLTNIVNSGFYGCSSLLSITIGNNITSIGDQAFRGLENLREVIFGNGLRNLGALAFAECPSLQKIELPNGLEIIGDAAFSHSALTEVRIPSSVTVIGQDAFDYCTSLETVDIASGSISMTINAHAFRGCSSIDSLNIPSRISSIGNNSFENCTNLSDLTIEEGTGSMAIGVSAFSGCSNLKTVSIGTCVDVIETYAFGDCSNLERITIGGLVQRIGTRAFVGCTNLQSASMSVETIDERAFSGCINLQTLSFSDNLKSIGNQAFYNCNSLQTLSLGRDLEEIGTDAFYGCRLLERLAIPEKVSTIGANAFYNCNSLKSLIIGNGVKEIGDNTFYRCLNLKSLDLGEVERIGNNSFNSCNKLKELSIPNNVTFIGSAAFKGCDSLQTLTLGIDLEEIEDEAFSGCKNIDKLLIPDKVRTIGSYAFHDCNNLTALIFGNNIQEIGDYAFNNCTNLNTLSFGQSLKRIGKYSFYGCNRLTELTIPCNVTTIGVAAFRDCTSLTSISINEGNEKLSIGHSAFVGCGNLETLLLGNRVTAIGNEAFYGCSKLTYLEIGSSVKKIGDSAFEGCNNIETLTFDNGIQEMGKYAFKGCKKIKELKFPHSLTSIGESSFEGCNTLESLVMGNHVKSIPPNAFSGCSNLTTLTLSKDLESIGANAFRSCSKLDSIELGSNIIKVIDSGAFSSCMSLKYLGLPNTLETIGYCAFEQCKNLEALIIPENVSTIGNYAFTNCGRLSYLLIGNHVENIGGQAFKGCVNLKSIVIPNSVNTIGESAFYGCDSLHTLTLGNSLTEIGENAFFNCRKLDNIYCKPTRPVNIEQSVFNINERYYDERYHYWRTRIAFNSKPTLYVSEASENMYQEHDVWKLFMIKPQMKMVAYYDTQEEETNNSRKILSGSDGQIVSNEGIEVEGVTADGTSTVFIYFDKDVADVLDAQLTFKIDNKVIEKSDPRVGTCGLFQVRGGKWGFVYTAPDEYLCDGNEYTLTIDVKVYNESNISIPSSANIRILRPGVILLHGFGSNTSCFDVLEKYLICNAGYKEWQVLNVDYSSSNTASFFANTYEHEVVGKNMEELRDKLLKNGIVASKFDLIGHSMGGILSRKYAQEVNPESVNRIITLDTPHYGSEFSSNKYELVKEGLIEYFTPLALLDPVAKVVLALFVDIPSSVWDKYSAFNDLKVNSDAIQELNNSNNWKEGAKDIPVHAICSYMYPIKTEEYCNTERVYHENGKDLIVLKKEKMSESPVAQCVGAHFFELSEVEDEQDVESNRVVGYDQYVILKNIFGGKNDGIVSLISQLGGLDPNSHYVSLMPAPFKGFYGTKSDAHHINTHHWKKTLDKIGWLLHSKSKDGNFSTTGFKPLPSSSRIIVSKVQSKQINTEFQDAKETSFIKIDVYKDAVERVIVVHVDKSEDVVRNMVFAKVGEEEILIATDSSDVCFEIPETYNGELKIYALGRTDYNALVADIASTEFTNSAVLNKLFFEDNTHITMNVGEQADRKVMGWWSNGEDTYISPVYSTNAEGIIEIEGSTIKAVGDGECMLKASYLGLSDSILVTIVAPVTELEISQTSVSLAGGDTIQLEASVNEDASNKDIVWSSTDSSIASVNSDGVVRGLCMGTTVITATSAENSNLKKECVVTVTSDPDKMLLPDVAFEFYYNAEDYDETTNSIPNNENANLQGSSLKLSGNIPSYIDKKLLRIENRCEGYIDKWNKGATSSGSYFYRSGQNCMTIVAKVAPSQWDACDFICNRGYRYNYMWRIGESVQFLHTSIAYGENRALPLNSTLPQVLAVRVNGPENYILLENLTTGERKRVDGISWGGSLNAFKLFYNDSNEYYLGDFYWVYYSFEFLTDEQMRFFVEKKKPGDANGDGVVNIADITAIINCINGDAPANFNRTNADVNGDGNINIADITAIINIINQ